MNIRAVNAGDYEVVNHMMQDVHALHVENRPDFYAELTPVYELTAFLQWVNDENCIFVLAEDEAGLFGLCQVTLRNKSGMINKKMAYMDVLFVTSKSRGKGIGKQLFSYVSTQAKEKGADRLDLMVWSFNEQALTFYEELGMTPQRYIFEKSLD